MLNLKDTFSTLSRLQNMDDRGAEDSDCEDQKYVQANTLKFSKIKECLNEGFDAFETERII